MISWLFVLLVACSIACVAFGNANTLQTKLSNVKTHKQFSTSSLDTPTAKPTAKAKASPTAKPVAEPTDSPISVPTDAPTSDPTVGPTAKAEASPTAMPIAEPTANPVVDPTTAPTFVPTEQPVAEPTANPIVDPTTAPTFAPTKQPIVEPTLYPIVDPTTAPTFVPTEQPIAEPTEYPIANPTFHPTEKPIAVPTYAPTNPPIPAPTRVPTGKPIVTPTAKPVTRAPTAKRPSARPTRKPTMRPSRKPTMRPSRRPTRKPTAKPKAPTRKPTRKPTMRPTTKSQRRPICRVSQQFYGVTIDGYEQDPEGCNSVIKATIAAAVKGITTDNVVDPEVYELSTDDDGNLRVSALENVPQGITLEYTIAVDPDSPMTYDEVATQLAESVDSHQFNDMLHQFALELNVTQLTTATSQSVETSEAATGDSSSRGSGDALKDDAIVGIAVGLCAALLLAAYFARQYVLRRTASRSNSVEMTAAKSPLSAVTAHTADHEEGWTSNPLSSSHGPNISAPQAPSSTTTMPASTTVSVAQPFDGSEA